MHHEIRHSLEDYLRGPDLLEDRSKLKVSASGVPAEFHAHLGECRECAGELRSLEAQSQLLRSLRSPRDVEPRAGFYGRLMERIEAQPASIWSVFLDPKFGFRLSVASAALLALLGTYLVTTETNGPEFASSPAVVLTDPPGTSAARVRPELNQPELNQAELTKEDGLRQQQQRDAVLVDLASYHQ